MLTNINLEKKIRETLSKCNLLFVFLFLLTFNVLIRLGTYSLPINDKHNFRQTDTYATILLLYEGKTDVFHPKFFQAPDSENIGHYYLAEFPIYQSIIVILFRFFGENLILARLVNVLIFSLGCFSVYILTKKLLGDRLALLAALLLAIFPSSFFWARAITPDILALVALVLSITVLLQTKHTNSVLISTISISIAVLIKPFYLVFSLTHLFILFSIYKERRDVFIRLIKLYLLPVILFLSWQLWFLSFPSAARTDPSLTSLMHDNMGYLRYWQTTSWMSVFLQERFMGELLTPLGGILSLVGLTVLIIKEKTKLFKGLLLSWFTSSSLITIFVANGSLWHDYYSLHWLPLCAILIAYAVKAVSESVKVKTLITLLGMGICFFLFYYLGYLPFLSYKANYFLNTAFYSDALNKDYISIQKIVSADDQVVFLLPQWTPQPLNAIRRFGFIFDYNSLCAEGSDPYAVLDGYAFKGAQYGAMYVEKNDALDCLLNNHPKFMQEIEKSLIFKGKGFFLFKLNDI